MASNEGEYKTYLGDGVYASFDGYHVVLHTGDETDIYLEFEVFIALKHYGNKVWEINE